ncbi:MAG: tetratricopeptide repeat protein [Deltaproteobacteria bacterium]|nr:tetratricopeptide repeat protein [Deltaproteobacteria bacterium]
MLNKLNISPERQKLIIYIVLTVVTLAVFWQVNQYTFINFDDNLYVTENSHIKSGITLEGFRWAFGTKYLGLWNPLVWLSFMLDYQLYGLNASGYHVTNLILHIMSTLLLFWLLNRMTGAVWKSAFVAAVFALHPLHVESVAWIAERKDVLSAFFWMLTLCLYVYYTEKPVIRRYLLVLFSFVCALMSKPMVVTLPVIMILLDYWPLGRFESKKDNLIIWQLKEKIPFFILSAVLVIVTLYNPNDSSPKLFPLGSRIANAPVAFVTYLEKTFWPHDMAIFYPFPSHIPIWQIIGASLLIIFISAVVIAMAKRLPYLFVGWMWYAITIVPVIGIIHISYYAMADHYHYLPSVGIAIMLAWGIPALIKSEEIKRKILFPAGIITLAIMAVLTWKQCGYWKNSITLFNHALQVTKNNYIVHGHLGVALFTKGKTEEAIDHYNKALRITPCYSDTYNNRGIAYYELGKYQQAIEDYNVAIHLNQEYAQAYNNRGLVYSRIGKYQQAIEDYNVAIYLNPEYADAYYNRGIVYNNLGQYQRAIEEYSEAIRLKKDYADAYNNRGTIYGKHRQYQLAIEDFNKAILLKSDYANAYYNRGRAYNIMGQYQSSIENYNETIRLKPDDADAYNDRAIVYLNQGNKKIGCHDAKKACAMGVCKALVMAKNNAICR